MTRTSARELGAPLRFVGALAVLGLVVGCAGGSAPRDSEGLGVVTSVIDGDTVDIDIAGKVERVRLIGIDTPESVKPNSPVECYGPEASAFTESLLPAGTAVRLERDIVGRDVYGRLLAYLYRVDEGTLVNYEIVRSGYARPSAVEPNTTKADTFADAARLAETDNLGMWAACAG